MRNAIPIVIAEADPGLVRLYARTFQLNGFKVTICVAGADILRVMASDPPAIILLGLPDSVEICKQIREEDGVAVIILADTQPDDEYQAIVAFNAGADDYVRKPVGVNELIARCRAILRREPEIPSRTLVNGPLLLDEDQHLVMYRGREIQLTRTEFGILLYLAQNVNRVVTHDQILRNVWGEDFNGQHHVLRVAISRLRHRIDEGIIETLPGVGYRLKRLS